MGSYALYSIKADLVPGHSDFRWAKKGEQLPTSALWFDEDPEDTTVRLECTKYSGLYKMARDTLTEIHNDRHKDWPSDAHGLCGVVVPIKSWQGEF